MPPKKRVTKEKKDLKKPESVASAVTSSSQDKSAKSHEKQGRVVPTSKVQSRRLKEQVTEPVRVSQPTAAVSEAVVPERPQEPTMSDKSDLKAELERKKQRLAQIREEKKRKEEERKKKEAELQHKAEPIAEDSDLDRKRRETEALLQSIGISPEPPLVQPFLTLDTCYFHYLVPTPMSPSSKSLSTPSEAGSQDSVDGTLMGRTLQWDTDPSVLQLHSDSELGRRLIKLGVSKVTQVDFLPREVVSYSKETQTPVTTHQTEGDYK
ncbi:hypothetical protein XELAEV_18030883mg [Xenopus laevis]|uniref:Uncharacterized protein n=1 Tax=Xenopus laevis TaxID=8355 RepID=A0A974CLR4_XENLA|nr:hypothetical protein XELAEV_18030883mg [Xenopus laevis]